MQSAAAAQHLPVFPPRRARTYVDPDKNHARDGGVHKLWRPPCLSRGVPIGRAKKRESIPRLSAPRAHIRAHAHVPFAPWPAKYAISPERFRRDLTAKLSRGERRRGGGRGRELVSPRFMSLPQSCRSFSPNASRTHYLSGNTGDV